MAKYENPVRGYISCPVCQSAATTHQVGEGQLIASGEPPKTVVTLDSCITVALSAVIVRIVKRLRSSSKQILSQS